MILIFIPFLKIEKWFIFILKLITEEVVEVASKFLKSKTWIKKYWSA
jgi:hypothetical protein